jgi:hypothetical protein
MVPELLVTISIVYSIYYEIDIHIIAGRRPQVTLGPYQLAYVYCYC